MADRILVDPAQLEAQAGVVRNQIRQMSNGFETIKREITKSNSFWKGKAGDAHRKRYTDRIAKIEEMLKEYQDQVADLELMAGVYREGEQSAKSVADELPPINL